MRKITIVQLNWNGRGDNRTFTRWAKPEQLQYKLRRISEAYNMDHTTVTVS